MILRRLEEDKQRALERAELARRDLGTNLLRHGFFRTRLAFEVERARRTDEPIALLLVDLDRFAAFNERCGHEAGDEALRAVARSLEALWIGRPSPRPPVLARDEGDRFAILLPAADAGEAEQRAESARGLVERLPLGPPRLTVSIGGAVAAGRTASAPALLAAAAASLAAARREGENSALLVRIDG
jgi:diguanylate cyclase (GGDEF)-like protein